jgi:UDP-N-acetylmuramyl pentapeptide synthase
MLYKVSSPGRHFALNALGALAVAEALGADPMIAAHDLGRWAPPAGRGQRERITLDIVEETFFDLIDDAFNANPASMAAALDVLIAAKPNRWDRTCRRRSADRRSGRHAGTGADRDPPCTATLPDTRVFRPCM